MSEESNNPVEPQGLPSPDGSKAPSKLKLTPMARNRLAGYFDTLYAWKVKADKKKAAASAVEPPAN